MHLLVDNVRVKGLVHWCGKLVICGGDLCGVRFEEAEKSHTEHTGEPLRLGTLERSGGISNTVV